MSGGRYVEMAVCDNCRRVFHAETVRDGLCPSCAARRSVPKPSEPPAGWEHAVCPDCGGVFARVRNTGGRRREFCWKCADRRRKESNRAALRKLRAARKAAN